jgi:hypothetical protein
MLAKGGFGPQLPGMPSLRRKSVEHLHQPVQLILL